ncbi:methylated-DNA--[protein]-cysteine S-methyltransferase [Bacillus sp. FJAT-47783]|uniref:methylated-DNA--[protein]-cysteine S-methyltransferase n=1 Tax=Bacillus sp. FJAT-47783 TaxID=2922712 RepID=UPI001FAB3E80|nr:methylated-DNA--[protein]-cysteine S-methyltransferase [Bacillus sp. FJAT-47783]
MFSYCILNAPIGSLYILEEEEKLSQIFFDIHELNRFCKKKDVHQVETPLLKETMNQLREYFEGKRTQFDLPLKIEGTSFQQRVWNTLKSIPYGETWSYQDVANHIEKPKAVRAIGQANKRNPLPIVIPCHRVIGKNHQLVGYAGNQTDKKAYLLTLEQAPFKKSM